MQSLRSWFGGTTATDTPLASGATAASTAAASGSSDSSGSARSSRSASFCVDSQQGSLACTIVEDYASVGNARAQVAASTVPPRKRSWRDVVAAASGFDASSASHFAAAAESDEACSPAIPALAPLLRSSSSMSSDVSLISGRSVSPFTLSSSDDFRSDDDEAADAGELVADLLAADSAAGDLADSLLFDLAEETDEGERTEDETEEHMSAHTADGYCLECMELAAFEAAEAQYERSSVGCMDFKLRPAVYDWHGKLAREVSFPFGKALGLRRPREQQASTRKKRELTRWPKDTERVPASYKQISSDSTLALQRASGTCDDCARIGEANDPIKRRRRGCNCALAPARADELQRRRIIEQLKTSRLSPSDPDPAVLVPYELTSGKKLKLRPDATFAEGSTISHKRRRSSASPAANPAFGWGSDEDEHDLKSAAIKAQRAATRLRAKHTEAARALHTPKRDRPVSGTRRPSKRYLADNAPYDASSAIMRSAPFEELRQNLFTQLQTEGIIDSIRTTHDASLLPVALHLAPVDPATVRQFMRERMSVAPHQRIEPCFSLTSTPSNTASKPWMRAWSNIQDAANPPVDYAYTASDFAATPSGDANRRHMLIGLGIRRYQRPPAGSPPVPEFLRRYLVRGGAHQGRIGTRQVWATWAVVLLPLFVLEYEVLPTPLDLHPHSEPISKHLAQRVLAQFQSRRKLQRRVQDTAPLLSSLFDLAPRVDCCTDETCCPGARVFAERNKTECDAVRMEEAFLERSLIVQSQPVAATWDQRRSLKFRRSAGICM